MTNTDPLSALPPEDSTALRELTERIDAVPDVFGKSVTPERGESGVTQIGYANYGSLVRGFLGFVYAKNLVVQFNWPGCVGRTRSNRDSSPVQSATPDDTLK